MASRMTQHIGRVISILLMGLVFALPARANETDLPKPTGAIVLTVGGDISRTNGPGVAQFDRDMLSELGLRQFTTGTVWTDGLQEFEGVPLAALLEAVGAEGGVMSAMAVNDYSVDIPVSDATPEGPIIALKLNGSNMTLRDKGPLWIVYPYDSDPAYRTQVVYARSIWQLDRITVRP